MAGQAYEGERSFIVAGERYQERRGYEAHEQGKALAENPNYPGTYDFKAWEHGWECRAEGIVPLGVMEMRRKEEPDGQ